MLSIFALKHLGNLKRSCVNVTRSYQRSWKDSFVKLKNDSKPGKYFKKSFVLVGTGASVGLGSAFLINTNKNTLWDSIKTPLNPKCQDSLVRPALEAFDVETEDDETPQEQKNPQDFNWYQFWLLLKPHLLLFAGAIAGALVVAYLNIQIPSLLGALVNVVGRLGLGQHASVYLRELKTPAMKLIFYYGLQSIFTFVYIALLSSMGERMACQIRKELFASILRQDIAFFDARRSGELVNRLTTDVQDFKSSFKSCISQGLRSVAQTVGCVCSLYMISPNLTAVMAVVLPSMVGIGALFGSGLRKLSQKAAAQVERATSLADEALGNVRTVRAFAMESKEMELYQDEIEKAAKYSEHLGVGIGAFQGLTNFALNGIVLGVICMGGYMMSTQNLSGGELMSFLVATQTIQRSLAQMSLLYGQFVKGIAAGARIFQYINLEPEIRLEGGRRIPYHTLRGDIEFRNVDFAYPTRHKQQILHDFNLKIPAGSVVAICGPSGGGKSTLALLLERFYDVDGGNVTIDGVDIRDLDPKWLRGQMIGFINQEPVLFATTVMENIRYGHPNATEQQAMEAAKMANADEFIRQFPNGYKTIVGERGVTMSGGQKQRIAIARALVKNPSILILDEATSALDAESERQVQETIEKVVKGRTVLVIAHRLSTIQNANMIAVMAGGQIAEMGNHTTLKKLKGLYWSLIKQQEAGSSFT